MSKKVVNEKKRGTRFELDKSGQPKVCDYCHQKIRAISVLKVMNPEQIAKRQARIDRMQAKVDELRILNS